MRNLLMRSFLIWCLHFALIVGVRTLTNREPLLIDNLSKVSECQLPCWIGISPGLTSIESAEKLITQTYADSVDTYTLVAKTETGYRVQWSKTGQYFHISFAYWQSEQPEERRFHEIILSPCDSCVLLGDMYTLVGQPTKVVPASQTVEDKYLYLVYEDIQLLIKIEKFDSCDSVSPDQAIHSLMIFDRIPSDLLLGSTNWRGFSRCYKSQ
jgi:hypothetical protein